MKFLTLIFAALLVMVTLQMCTKEEVAYVPLEDYRDAFIGRYEVRSSCTFQKKTIPPVTVFEEKYYNLWVTKDENNLNRVVIGNDTIEISEAGVVSTTPPPGYDSYTLRYTEDSVILSYVKEDALNKTSCTYKGTLAQ